MILRDFLNDILDDQFIWLKLGEYGFASSYGFLKCRVNKNSKLLDCKVISFGVEAHKGDDVIVVRIECDDLNDVKNFFKKD